MCHDVANVSLYVKTCDLQVGGHIYQRGYICCIFLYVKYQQSIYFTFHDNNRLFFKFIRNPYFESFIL